MRRSLRAERANAASAETTGDRFEAQKRLRLTAVAAAREKLAQHTDQVDAEKHRAMIEELDLEEQQTRGTWGNQAQALQSNPSVP